MEKDEVRQFWSRVQTAAEKKGLTMLLLWDHIGVSRRTGYGWVSKGILPDAARGEMISWEVSQSLTTLLWDPHSIHDIVYQELGLQEDVVDDDPLISDVTEKLRKINIEKLTTVHDMIMALPEDKEKEKSEELAT